MEMCDKNDLLENSDENGDDVSGAGCGNLLHGAKAKQMCSKGKEDGVFMDTVNHFNFNVFVPLTEFTASKF